MNVLCGGRGEAELIRKSFCHIAKGQLNSSAKVQKTHTALYTMSTNVPETIYGFTNFFSVKRFKFTVRIYRDSGSILVEES